MNEKRQAIEALKENGYQLDRSSGDHYFYWNEELKSEIPISKGSKFDKNDKDRILQEIRQAKWRKGQK